MMDELGEEVRKRRGEVVLPHEPTWLLLPKAAEHFGLTPPAVRMRFRRGTWPSELLRREGRVLWLDCAGLSRYLGGLPHA